ncbi:hypothetical protein [Gordonia shandongensis]|uniref:hypothetical protein n=1 Tax=Gordonia shandongensis TaxID=376351 RepID=UPI000412D954|nr:hypothetical protein [Gordonia shandongensis]
MPNWIIALFVALLVASLVSLILARRGHGFGQASAASGYVDGTLTITGGVAGDADRNGQRVCTITGIIVGPGAAAVEVYRRIILTADDVVPAVGLDQPVVYKPGKVESTWRFGTLSDSVG